MVMINFFRGCYSLFSFHIHRYKHTFKIERKKNSILKSL
jgi:hypothetical protein